MARREEEFKSGVDQVLTYGEHTSGVRVSLTTKDIIIINGLLAGARGQLDQLGLPINSDDGLGETPLFRSLAILQKMVDPLKGSNIDEWAHKLFS